MSNSKESNNTVKDLSMLRESVREILREHEVSSSSQIANQITAHYRTRMKNFISESKSDESQRSSSRSGSTESRDHPECYYSQPCGS